MEFFLYFFFWKYFKNCIFSFFKKEFCNDIFLIGIRKCEKFNLLEISSGNKNIIYVLYKFLCVLY